ncbi:DEKNAAC103211 [Brettanomyces naardenensis]|uniref:DEKNAAC103211 n=1 Tax=Brettanomyces naardenensis TaxID=13370 RepID=A0A448YMP2_BRENA|nr:DEKNAAC103211 [Brettanomyces naardenensis]
MNFNPAKCEIEPSSPNLSDGGDHHDDSETGHRRHSSDRDGPSLSRFDSAVLSDGLPYTILRPLERRALSVNLSLMGLCCSISISIYWVALTEMMRDFNITEEQVNLTITAYLVFQAVSPVVVSNMSDHYGRRPILLICLAGGTAANIGLAVCSTYWLLMLMRCVLALFFSPIISITSSVIGDFTTRRDRGGVSGIVLGFTLIGQGIAPFLGSLFDTRWGWRAIFWFSGAYSGTVFAITLVMFPETRRSIVGNLSHRPKNWIHCSPPLLYFGKRLIDVEGSTLEPSLSLVYNPLEPLLLVKEPEVVWVLLPSAIFYCTFTMSQTSLTTNLAQEYNYSTLKIGLCFLAPGIGTVVGTVMSGKLLDIRYRSTKKKYVTRWELEKQQEGGNGADVDNEDNVNEMNEDRSRPFEADTEQSQSTPDGRAFPLLNIIKARLSLFGWSTAVVVIFVLVYGWCSQERKSVAAVLIGSFFMTVGSQYPLSAAMTLMVDLHPQTSGAATSMNNLFRCGFGSIFVSCLAKMNTAMTLGGTYSLMAGLCLLSGVSVHVLLWKSEEILDRKAVREARQGDSE